jgi:hypothetical protein
MKKKCEVMAGATRLEPAASCVTGRRSNQLNYAIELLLFFLSSIAVDEINPRLRLRISPELDSFRRC